MGLLEKAKAAGYSEKEAKDFETRVTKAKKAGYTNEEIQAFLEESGGIPAAKSPEIRAPNELDEPNAGSLRAPRSAADQTADLIRGGRPSTFTQEVMKDAPEIAGATAMVAAAPTGIGIPAAMGLAALGGAGGKGYQLAAQQLQGQPMTSGGAAAEVAGAGARQGVAEGLGRAVIKAIGRVWRGGFFTPSEGMTKTTPDLVPEGRVANKEALFAGKKPPIPKEELLKKPDVSPKDLMESFGGNYTAAQMSNSRVLDTLDNMAQGSFFGGGIMDRTFSSQQKTVKQIGDTVADTFIAEGGQKLSDRQLGQLFVDTIQDGRAAFKTSAEKMFRNVDDTIYEGMQMASPEGTTVSVGESIMGVPGMPETLPTKKPSQSGYVNVKPLVEKANDMISQYSRVRNIGKSDVGGTLLDKVAALPETMTFGDAQLLRSNLLEELRGLSQKPGEGKAARVAGELAGLADKQMETAAKNLSGEALKAWRDANKFYKFGKTNFDNQFIAKLAQSGKVNWEEVGDLIFRSGNVEEVHQARRALRAAEFASRKANGKPLDVAMMYRGKQYVAEPGELHADLAARIAGKLGVPENQILDKAVMGFRKGDKWLNRQQASALAGGTPGTAEHLSSQGLMDRPIKATKAWRSMQAGYYESLIKKNTNVDGILKPDGLLKDLSNRKTERTINAAFNNDQLSAIRNFAKVAKMAESKNASGTGSMVIQFAQGGALLSMTNPGEILGDNQDLINKVAGGVLIGPPLLAKLLTNPMTTRWLIQGVRTPVSSGVSGALAARLGLSVLRAAQNQNLPTEDEGESK